MWSCSAALCSDDIELEGCSPMAMDLETVKRLVQQHAPVLYMHPSDRFMPCSVEWFMDHSELWLHSQEDGVARSRRLLKLGDVTGVGIAAAQQQHWGALLQLRLNPSAQCGPPVEEVDESPLYANVKWVVRPDGTPEAIEINYLTFYAHNGWYDIGYLGLLKVGAHDGDWEHLTVRLSAATGELQGVYFNAHRSRDGCWVPASRVERCSNGRLIAYVARHGHGTYPRAGIWWRAGLMANDLTSSSGPVWRPKVCYLLPVPSNPRGLTVSIDRLAENLQAATLDSDIGESFATARAMLLSETSTRDAVNESPPPPGQSSCCREGGKGKVLDCQGAASGERNSADPLMAGVALDDTGVITVRALAESAPTKDLPRIRNRAELLQAASRGSSLPLQAASIAPRTGSSVIVLEHSGEWLDFLGEWGTTPSPAAQDWFWSAEPPVSRGVFLRVLGHPWPETLKI